MTTVTVAVEPVLLLYAFRYALGRRSYAVGDVCAALITHRDALTADWRQQIVQDIHNAMNGEGVAAMSAYDIDAWQHVAVVMSR